MSRKHLFIERLQIEETTLVTLGNVIAYIQRSDAFQHLFPRVFRTVVSDRPNSFLLMAALTNGSFTAHFLHLPLLQNLLRAAMRGHEPRHVFMARGARRE